MMYPPVHERPEDIRSFDRLEMLWERYPRYHEMTTFSTMEALLSEHESWQEEFEDVRTVFFASLFWKKLQAKMEKVASPKRRKLQAITIDSYRGSRNRIPVRLASRLSSGLRGISSPVPGSGIPRSA